MPNVTRWNCYRISMALELQYGEQEITEEQVYEEIDAQVGHDPRTKRTYIQKMVEDGQLERTINGSFIATPYKPETPNERIERLRREKKKETKPFLVGFRPTTPSFFIHHMKF